MSANRYQLPQSVMLYINNNFNMDEVGIDPTRIKHYECGPVLISKANIVFDDPGRKLKTLITPHMTKVQKLNNNRRKRNSKNFKIVEWEIDSICDGLVLTYYRVWYFKNQFNSAQLHIEIDTHGFEDQEPLDVIQFVELLQQAARELSFQFKVRIELKHMLSARLKTIEFAIDLPSLPPAPVEMLVAKKLVNQTFQNGNILEWSATCSEKKVSITGSPEQGSPRFKCLISGSDLRRLLCVHGTKVWATPSLLLNQADIGCSIQHLLYNWFRLKPGAWLITLGGLKILYSENLHLLAMILRNSDALIEAEKLMRNNVPIDKISHSLAKTGSDLAKNAGLVLRSLGESTDIIAHLPESIIDAFNRFSAQSGVIQKIQALLDYDALKFNATTPSSERSYDECRLAYYPCIDTINPKIFDGSLRGVKSDTNDAPSIYYRRNGSSFLARLLLRLPGSRLW